MKLVYTFLIAIFSFSCSSKCDDLDCGVNGNCDENLGSCVCDNFYEGDLCENETRTKFIGIWSGNGLCDSSSNTFDMILSVTAGNGVDELNVQTEDLLQNFLMTGKMESNSTLDIPGFMTNFSSSTFDGDLILNGDTLTMTLRADLGNGNISACTATLTK